MHLNCDPDFNLDLPVLTSRDKDRVLSAPSTIWPQITSYLCIPCIPK